MGKINFDELIILDGAMGTTIQNMGLKLGDCPELFNIENPELLKKIYDGYFEAGSNIILTNTFGANDKKLALAGLTPEDVIPPAVKLAKESAKKYNGSVALDIGPIGELLEPMGTLSFDDAYEIFKRQILIGVENGVDLIYCETFTDLYEIKAAVLAAKENCDLPIFTTMSFEENGRTFTGCIPKSMAVTLTGLGVDALGVNCSLGPKEMIPLVKEISEYTNLPIIIKPNAGLPKMKNNETYFDLKKEEFVSTIEEMIDLGVNVVGGCCGTTAEYITHLANTIKEKNLKPVPRKKVYKSCIASPLQLIEVDTPKIVGERINPTGKKVFKEALKNENYDYILKIAMEQMEKGASILDVNISIPDIDEKSIMVKTVKMLQSVVPLPLQIDSSDAEVLEMGMRYYNGKPLMNSVNGEDEVLDKLLPIASKYGSSIVALTLNKDGIPKTAEERVEIAKYIMEKAISYGIPKEDIYIDCLTLTAGAEQEIAAETLRATKMVKEDLGLKTTLGVSNISFGLPERKIVNRTFLTLALYAGLDLPIINPSQEPMVDAIYCVNQLTNKDKGSTEFVERFGNRKKDAPVAKKEENYDIEYYINLGMKDEARSLCVEMLKTTEPLTIVNEVLIPILDQIGTKFENNEIFLPQLISSAEASKLAFDEVKKHLIANGSGEKNENEDKKIILATVKGDIHDIGKNIVKVILENYGYNVIDLGKDVPIEKVVETCKKEEVKLVGLSALMTTTLKSMEETITALKDEGLDVMTMVGGAVLTQEYADNVGANFYTRNAQESVDVAKKVL